MRVTALAGGVGGAKLLIGLARVAGPRDLTAIVNTGDDADIYGLRVCPDLDIVTYWLAGIADTERGWGIAGDSFTVVDSLGRFGLENWFRLGDRDLATCIARTRYLAQGMSLSQATARITAALGVGPEVLPMSDDDVRTIIITRAGDELDFQTYFVKLATEVDVAEVRFGGIARARPAPGVIEAIEQADRVVLCPSNPVVSLGPILALPGVRDALRAHPSVIAVTPIVAGAPLKGPADKLLAATGSEVSAIGVARLYADFLKTFVLDRRDESQAGRAAELGVEVLVTDTVMTDVASSEGLAKEILF